MSVQVVTILAAVVGIALLGLLALLIVLATSRAKLEAKKIHLAANLADVRLEAVQGDNITLRNTSDHPHLSTLYVMTDGDLRNDTSTNASPVLLQYRFSALPRSTQTIDNTGALTTDLAGRRVLQEIDDGRRFVDIVGIFKN